MCANWRRISDYNKRLLLQADKQKSFCSNEHFQAVKVRASGNLPSGIAYIDMDYVQGVTAAEMLEILPLTDIQHWAAMLLDMASSSAQGQTAKTVAPAIFHNKIADLKRDLTARKMMNFPRNARNRHSAGSSLGRDSRFTLPRRFDARKHYRFQRAILSDRFSR